MVAIFPVNAVPDKLLHFTATLFSDTVALVTTAPLADFNCTIAFLTVFEYADAMLETFTVPCPFKKFMVWSVTISTVSLLEPIMILLPKVEFRKMLHCFLFEGKGVSWKGREVSVWI